MGLGILDSECRMLKSNISRMDRAIFRVCISFQYSAAKELSDFVKDSAGSPKSIDPQLHALERGRRNEKKQNEAAMQVVFSEYKIYVFISLYLSLHPFLLLFNFILKGAHW